MTTPSGTAAARRGRPRNAAVDRTVVETVLRLLADGATFGDLSMEGIAREAGVGKATVYRRWPGKDALLLDVLASLDAPVAQPPGTSIRADLLVAVESIRLRGVAKRESALMRNVLGAVTSSPGLWQRYYDTVIAGRRQDLARILERGIATGEVRAELGADMDLLLDFVTGPVLARTTLRPGAPLDESITERVVDMLLEGMRPRG